VEVHKVENGLSCDAYDIVEQFFELLYFFHSNFSIDQ